MKFGEIGLEQAEGAILAHAARAGALNLKKGTLLKAEDVAAFREAGMTSVIAALLDEDDVGEDEAAASLADAMSAPHLKIGPAATGRVNIHAECAGVFQPDRATIDALNAVDPAITLATLGENVPVHPGQMVATIKIIPLAVAGPALTEALAVLKSERAAIQIAPFTARNATLIQTTLPGTSAKMLEKTRRVTSDRLSLSGSRIVSELKVPHSASELAEAVSAAARGGSDLVLVFGASAVIDRSDVIPAAIEGAGGVVEYFGMPVDPGNLLLVGKVGDTPVVGAPGCARSPKENGFDWVLDRIVAGLDVTPKLLQSWGVGGLLAEIETRPRPRQNTVKTNQYTVDAVVLAAGRSTRMGEDNKLLMELVPGIPMICHTVRTALEAGLIDKVHVVLGHQADEVRTALQGLGAEFVMNADFADGLSTSLRAGFAAAAEADGVLVMLGDQPLLEPRDLDRLAEEFMHRSGQSIVAAADGGKRRNPVILPARCREDVDQLTGDNGAAPLMRDGSQAPVLVDIGEAASFDTDTPARFREAQLKLYEKN